MQFEESEESKELEKTMDEITALEKRKLELMNENDELLKKANRSLVNDAKEIQKKISNNLIEISEIESKLTELKELQPILANKVENASLKRDELITKLLETDKKYSESQPEQNIFELKVEDILKKINLRKIYHQELTDQINKELKDRLLTKIKENISSSEVQKLLNDAVTGINIDSKKTIFTTMFGGKLKKTKKNKKITKKYKKNISYKVKK